MLLNWVVGFIIPWIVCVYVLRSERRTILTTAPIMATLAFIIDTLGVHFEFWKMDPASQKTISTLPFDIGLYPAVGSLMVYLTYRLRIPGLAVVVITSIATTILEGIYFLIGKVTYGNGWNIVWTFISYLIPYTLTYWYDYYVVKRTAQDDH